ncbi:minor tail protein [Mycobacterium phage Shandong1]|uniref:Glycine-rich domain-containing protein n=1 Tax=Mycobacterium phage Shandong1 TaxID=1983447 RepID=A0A1X9SHJ2_9CAUD|nr:minor tail protein [Mycobacterium phage Shandong1]ARQ95467.1 hypothetical protein [Mycobacterium phage Shandong1]
MVAAHELAEALSISYTDAILAVRATAAAAGVSKTDAALLIRLTADAKSVSATSAAANEHYFGAAPAASSSAIAATAVPKLVADAAGVSATAAAAVVKATAATSSSSATSATWKFATQANPVFSQTYTTVGTYTFAIPWWANFIDVVLLGGGGGGSSGNAAVGAGSGGQGGNFVYVKLVRGVDIPYAATTITGAVPDGGAPGPAGFFPINGDPGGTATAIVNTLTWQLSATGGEGGKFLTGVPGDGANPNSVTFNGILYQGGLATSSSNGVAGNAPGGAGSGGRSGFFGIPAGAGGKGARGQVWIRAYQ